MRRTGVLYPLTSLRSEVDRVWDDFFGRPQVAGPGSVAAGAGRLPPINFWESGDTLTLEMELPGVKREEIEITIVGDELTLKGKRNPGEREGATLRRGERPFGEFVRVLQLPYEIDSAKVTASLESGVLILTLPKSEAAKPRKIEVQVKA